MKSAVQSGDLAKIGEKGKKRNTDYDFPPPYTNKTVHYETYPGNELAGSC